MSKFKYQFKNNDVLKSVDTINIHILIHLYKLTVNN